MYHYVIMIRLDNCLSNLHRILHSKQTRWKLIPFDSIYLPVKKLVESHLWQSFRYFFIYLFSEFRFCVPHIKYKHNVIRGTERSRERFGFTRFWNIFRCSGSMKGSLAYNSPWKWRQWIVSNENHVFYLILWFFESFFMNMCNWIFSQYVCAYIVWYFSVFMRFFVVWWAVKDYSS